MMTHLPKETSIIHLAASDFAAAINAKSGALAQECVVTSSMQILEMLREPSRIDAYLFFLCTGGRARLLVNLQEVELQPNMFFLAAPKHVLQLVEQQDFEGRLLLISSQLFGRLHIDTKQLMPLSIEAHRPHFAFSEQEAKALSAYMDLISNELSGSERGFGFELITSLLVTMMYKIGSLVYHLMKDAPKVEGVGSRAEDYFKQFIRVLSQFYLQERAVSFYAAKLNITPKYLTTLIKRVSGRSVSDWIDYYVIVEAKTMLKYSDRSIQEISNALNFANQSFFGSYFRRNVGMSPSQYRAKC